MENMNSNQAFINLQTQSDEHGLIFKILLYTAILHTLFLISYLYPPRFYKKFISFLFNLSFKWRGAVWKVYNILILNVFLLGLLLVCNYYLFSFEDARNTISYKKFEFGDS